MKLLERFTLLGVIVGIVATLLYPQFYIRTPNSSVINLAFAPLLDPPRLEGDPVFMGMVDVGMLVAEWVAIVLVTGALWLLVRPGRANSATEGPCGSPRSGSARRSSRRRWRRHEQSVSGAVHREAAGLGVVRTLPRLTFTVEKAP